MGTLDKIVVIDNEKYVRRHLYGNCILENLESQNALVKNRIENNTPWSTLTADGEAFIGDTIKFKQDGHEATIINILKVNNIVDNLANYIVIVRGIHNKAIKSEIPLNGRASWECNITKLYKKQNRKFFI